VTNHPRRPRNAFLLLLAGVACLSLLTGCTPSPRLAPPTNPAFGWAIDLERFRASAHGHLDCATCHPDISPEDQTAPHPDPARLIQDARALYDYARCASCHPNEYAAYEQGVHADARARSEEGTVPAPTCGDCHNAHYATVGTRAQVLDFVRQTCGDCHPEALETYLHDYHGKATVLGRENAATCADCHGAHNVLALNAPDEEVRACRRCHPQATLGLTGYYVHARETLQAAPEDPRRQDFALLFWVQLFFIVLTASVLAVFYAHTGLWFLRSLHERLRRPAAHAVRKEETGPEYWRFNIYHRLVHLLVLTSFFGSTISGMPLKYPTTRWAQWLTHLQGGVEVMGIIHRISAVVIAIWCLMHLAYIVHYVFVQKRKPWGPDTPVPTVKDFKDIWQNFQYFIGKGSRPVFDRFAYFEKFDYWAVFWGVPVIGLSGLVLWFEDFFSRFLPGIVINIAHIMHSDEALLAVGFIYIVHLFNTHIRFDKFPLNKVIFTGKVSEEELRHERPLEWERIQANPKRAEEMRVR
jgi:cytochrome b subunit of formate dehydrogenase